MTDTDIPLDLLLEYRLTIAHRLDCECCTYFINRGSVLLPEIMKQAEKENDDPVDVFHRFAMKVHARHGDQDPARGIASKFAALMAQVGADED